MRNTTGSLMMSWHCGWPQNRAFSRIDGNICPARAYIAYMAHMCGPDEIAIEVIRCVSKLKPKRVTDAVGVAIIHIAKCTAPLALSVPVRARFSQSVGH